MAEKVEIEEKSSGFFSYINPRENTKGFLIFIFACILALGVITYSAVSINKNIDNKKKDLQQKDSIFESLSNHTVVYGYWEGDSSFINSFDLKTGKAYNLAKLPSSIKRVNMLSQDTLIFINKTDDKDYGQELATFSINSDKQESLISADPDFGIDEYVMSDNKRFLAVWEINVPPDSTTLLGRRSRVYGVDLENPKIKHLIYEEVADKGIPIHYPLSAANDGKIIFDTFEPNSGLGWARGMNITSLDGLQKEDITSMAGTTYGTQPSLSSDGKTLAFAGYSGPQVSGSTRFANAILNSNTLETLTLDNKVRTILPNISTQDYYPYVQWDPLGRGIIYQRVSKVTSERGFYLFDTVGQSVTKLVATWQNPALLALSTIDQNQVLIAEQDLSESTFANLGPKYAFSLRKMEVYDLRKDTAKRIPISQSLVQYIAILPSSYLGSIPAAKLITKDGVGEEKKRNQLQLKTFTVKPSLAPKRFEQQSRIPDFTYDPSEICMDISCFPLDALQLVPLFGDCKPAIYLYPEKISNISVRIHSSITLKNTSPSYTEKGWSVVAKPSGEIYSDGKMYNYIYYEAEVPDRMVEKPKEGFVVRKSELSSLFSQILPKLGLNEKESREFKDYWIKTLPDASYYFVGIVSQSNLDKIFPFDISPRPDSIIRVTLFFESLDQKISVFPPNIVTPGRNGFAVVEWAGMFKRQSGQDFTCLE